MDLKEIQDLIKFVAKQGVSEVNLEKDDIKLTIRTGSKEDEKGEQNQQPVYAQMMPPQMMPQGIPQQEAAPQPPQQQQPAQQEAPKETQKEAPPQKGQESGEDESQYVAIKSPMIGTFYRSPSPDKDAYAKVGDKVEKGQVVCIVEAMKLFNEIESEVSGRIVKVSVENSAPVEYDQTLFLVDPNG